MVLFSHRGAELPTGGECPLSSECFYLNVLYDRHYGSKVFHFNFNFL